MSSRFYFGGSDDSGSDLDENNSTLPFPKPLDRAAFLTPDFDAATFLSSLSDRFQTLEDLQSELRELSQSLNKELVDLVNENYQDFLSLGSTLSGGEERIEDIRVGLLGFQRDVKSVQGKIDQRRNEVVELLSTKRTLKRDIGVGRLLLEFSEGMEELEEMLGLKTRNPPEQTNGGEHDETGFTWTKDWYENVNNDSDDDFVDEENVGISPRLSRLAEKLLIVKLMASRLSRHPFVLAQQSRFHRIHEASLLEIETKIKQEPDIKVKQQLLQLRMSIVE